MSLPASNTSAVDACTLTFGPGTEVVLDRWMELQKVDNAQKITLLSFRLIDQAPNPVPADLHVCSLRMLRESSGKAIPLGTR